ncbi:hypothetical protein MHO82_24535 [Vibrio sp. Of7-15]|uniref:hypothetical protein n=1 Tax=Vibrio sp. Of7-15 TaxID=2724879 RepID=UPI001EF21C30|nr:hypothetical protein [Vibrio sp. Of7-15]MCG7500035.1 hypothetical protein [Vibrio sp. Of7-15]
MKLNESSTKTGLVLLGTAATALVTGQTQLIDIDMTNSGLELGGLIPSIIMGLVGFWDIARTEKKG